jgi:hypothetical protein
MIDIAIGVNTSKRSYLSDLKRPKLALPPAKKGVMSSTHMLHPSCRSPNACNILLGVSATQGTAPRDSDIYKRCRSKIG